MRFPIAASSVIALVSLLSDVDAGLLSAFAVDPNNPQVQFAGADMNGLSKSVNGGATWRTLWEGVENESVDRFISDIVIDPHDANTVYVGITGQGYQNLATGLARSTDGGETWESVNNGLGSPFSVFSPTVDPFHPDVIYVGTDELVFRSDDGGESWHDISPGPSVAAIAVNPHVPDRVYALARDPAANLLLYRTSDSGASWTETTSRLPVGSAHIEDITFDPHDNTTLYTYGIHVQPDFTGILFKSTNEGATWQTLWELKGGYLRSVLVDPADADVIYAGSGGKVTEPGLYRSVDGGSQWTRHHNGNVVDLSLDPDAPNSLFLGARLQGVLHLFFDAPGTAVGPATWGRVKNAYPLKAE
jgi:photosystem II stability/assembly factor-like uncharacterized protein